MEMLIYSVECRVRKKIISVQMLYLDYSIFFLNCQEVLENFFEKFSNCGFFDMNYFEKIFCLWFFDTNFFKYP